jgi:thiamine monophosphate synthase
MEKFLLVVLTLPGMFAGEADQLEALMDAGVDRLHLRKPAADPAGLEGLLRRLAPRWSERLVLHGGGELALRYGIRHVHGSVEFRGGRGRSGGGPFVGGPPVVAGGEPLAGGPFGVGGGEPGGTTISTSVHSWEEFGCLPEGLAYAFISPLFDSISKVGYMANEALLTLPLGGTPCLPVGLGGVNVETLGEMVKMGWKGAAVLGWIWEEPRLAVRRFEQLKKVADGR